MARNRTREERALKRDFRAQAATLKSERLDEYNRAAGAQREAMRAHVRDLRRRQREERALLRQKQSSLWSRFRRAVDWTGRARRQHLERRREQVAKHKTERHDLAMTSREAWQALRDSVAGRFAPREAELKTQRAAALTAIREMHMRGEAMADAKRQLREMARERERMQMEEAIRLAQQHERSRPSEPGKAQSGGSAQGREAFRAAREWARHIEIEPRRRSRDGPDLGR